MQFSAQLIITETVRLYRKHLGVFLRYSGLLTIPLLLLAAVQLYVKGGTLLWSPQDNMLLSVILFPFAALALFFTIGLSRACSEAIQGQPITPISAELRAARGRFFPVLLATLANTFIFFGGILLFIVPGLIFFIWYFFATQAAAIDDQPGIQALKYSKWLVSGLYWETLWFLAAPFFVFLLATQLIQYLVITLPADIILRTVIEQPMTYLVGTYAYNGLLSLFAALTAPLLLIPIIMVYEFLKALKQQA
jgi:hypothetical protein